MSGRSIVRVRHKRAYTVVTNSTIRDERLSYRARGLLMSILSYPDGTAVDATSLAERAKEGRDAVRAALAELRTHGYLKQYRERGGDGLWRMVSEVSEIPLTGDGKPGAGKPGAGNPGAGKPGAVLTTSTEIQVLPDPRSRPSKRDESSPPGRQAHELWDRIPFFGETA